MNQEKSRYRSLPYLSRYSYLFIALLVSQSSVVLAAEESKETKGTLSEQVKSFFSTKPSQTDQINSAQISDFDADIKSVDVLPTIYVQAVPNSTNTQATNNLTLLQAIRIAVERHPSISAAIAALSQQHSGVDVAKSAYWPQLQAGVTTGRLGTGSSKEQVFSVTANQTLYDFGKVKNNVKVNEASVSQQQANILGTIDSVALQTAEAVVNVSRYQSLVGIAQAQVNGISRILNIARLRANAGLTSQADPIQAQTRYDSAQSTLLQTKLSLRQWEERLKTLTGLPTPYTLAAFPEGLLRQAKLYENPLPSDLPTVIAAEYERQAALAQKELAHANRMPTLSLDGSVNKALNGRNPNNNKEDGTYSSVMLKVSSATWQGSALASRERAASYAIEAARAKKDAAYLEAADQIKNYREQILGIQERLSVLASREQSIIKTRELYEDQYKLGTRTVLDLLNSEQEIQFAASERENARFDTWQNLVNYIGVTGRSRDIYALNDTSIQGIEIK